MILITSAVEESASAMETASAAGGANPNQIAIGHPTNIDSRQDPKPATIMRASRCLRTER